MTWLSKNEILASDQGLTQITESIWKPATLGKKVFICFLLSLLAFSSVTGLLYLIGVSNPAIKWPIAVGFLLIGLLCGVAFYGCLSKN
jgi:hypothetical protein